MSRLVTADPSTVCPMDREDGIHDWIVAHPEIQVYHDIVDNNIHAGYSVYKDGVKIGEVFSPFTYAWTAIYFAPDGHRYGLINECFEGNHPAIRAFNSLMYHVNAWGRKDGYNAKDLVWVDINGHKFIKMVVTACGIVTSVIHTLGLSWVYPFNVHWDDNKQCYIKS